MNFSKDEGMACCKEIYKKGFDDGYSRALRDAVFDAIDNDATPEEIKKVLGIDISDDWEFGEAYIDHNRYGF